MYKSPPIASFEVPLSEILKAEGVVEKSFVVGKFSLENRKLGDPFSSSFCRHRKA